MVPWADPRLKDMAFPHPDDVDRQHLTRNVRDYDQQCVLNCIFFHCLFANVCEYLGRLYSDANRTYAKLASSWRKYLTEGTNRWDLYEKITTMAVVRNIFPHAVYNSIF